MKKSRKEQKSIAQSRKYITGTSMKSRVVILVFTIIEPNQKNNKF